MRNGMHVNVLGALCMAVVLWGWGGASAPESPVADAAMRGDIETVRSLLREGADVNAAQGDGMTALHWSAVNDNAAMIELLLYAGATLESTTRLGGYTPLHLASREGQSDAVRALLEGGSKPNTFTTTGVSAVHLAAQAGKPDAIRALIGHGGDVDARDRQSGRTPLIFATAQNRLEAIATLIEAGADVSLATDVKDYPVLSANDGRERSRRARIRKAALDPEPETQATGEPSPAGAQRQGRPGQPATPYGRAGGAVPDSTPTPDSTAAPAAVADTAAPANLGPPEPDHPTLLPDTTNPAAEPPTGGTANQPRPLSYTDLVGQQGGMTALHYTMRDGQTEAARLLLESGADINQVTLGDQSTPLLVAIINGNFDLAMMLLEMGADPTLVSEDGAAPLFATINNEWALRTWYPQPTASRQQKTSYLELMEALLVAGADPNVRLKTHIWYASYNAGRMGVDFADATAFWRAAYATDVAGMRLLAAYGADPNIRTIKPAQRRRRFGPNRPATPDSTETEEDPSGLPLTPVGGPAVHPLHAASGVGYGTSRVGQQHRHVPDGWLPAVRYLVEELGVDVNVRDHDGYSALHHAAARGDNKVIEFLVKHGADVMFVSRRGQTTVDMANGPQQRVQPFFDTIALLESLGAKNNNNCLSC